MSSTGRTTSKGGKGAKADKSHKTDGGKGGGDKTHNKENTIKIEELGIKDKVKQLMEMTCRSEDEVCLALHESNNDMNMAINLLYEEIQTGEWETKDKKKKKRQASAGKDKKPEEGTGGGNSDWDDSAPPPPPGNNGGGDGKEWKERGGGRRDNKSGGPGGAPRRWREEGSGGGRGGDRRGSGRGSTRGGGGGRGRGGGRAGGRFPPRGPRGGGGRDYNRQPIDTWDNSNTWDNNTAATVTNHTPAADDWDDFHTDEWSTEEYTGSLVETKVFTPSVPSGPQENNVLDTSVIQGLDQSLSGSSQLQDNSYSQTLSQGYNQTVQQLPQQQSPVPPMVGTLTAAQTQYFSQLSQQNSDALGKQYGNAAYQTQQNAYDSKANVQQVYNSSSQVYPPSTQTYGNATQQSYSNAAQPYNSTATQQSTYGGNASQGSYGNQSAQSYNSAVSQGYGNAQQTYGSATAAGTNNYGGYQSGTATYGSGQEVQQQPQRTKTQRARVPPPSKIPASAVEMPGDLNSSITYLDVQFGAMDVIDTSFESSSGSDVKYGAESNRSTTGLDNSRSTPTSGLELDSSGPRTGADYGSSVSSGKNGAPSSISSALSQGLSNTDTIPQASAEHLNYNNAAASRNAAQSSSASTSVPSVTSASAIDLNKQSADSHSYNSQTAAYNSYQSKTNSYGTSAYGSTQTTASSYVNPSANSYVNNQANSYATGAQNSSATGAYGNSYSSSTGSAQVYQSAASYPTVTQASYAASAQNASVYGASAGLSNNPNYNTSTSNQYNSYNSTTSGGGGHKLGGGKENSYDSTGAATSTANSNAPASSAAALSLSQTTISGSKTTATLAKNSTSVISNMPPGVTPVMSTPYIMGQVPYFQQPVYSYEEMQLLQQRLPHMTTPYYDMAYQTPTTVRDPTAAALGGYGAATADARFQAATGRAGDGTTSPVPAASQQQQQQPILAAAAGTPQPYFFTAFNTIAAPPPNYAQFGTMYTQLPAVTNAHGSSASSQYGPKPATYGSAGYGAYDALGQSAAAAQDYAKSGYAVGTAAVAAHQAAQKGQQNSSTGVSAANDINAMYGKSHAALGKVNSYEKQGFHSGTPPPFTGALSQSAGLAPSGAGYAPQVYIPTMAMHQPLHQMDVRHQSRRADSGNSTGQRSQGSNQAKAGPKQGYGASYWNQN